MQDNSNKQILKRKIGDLLYNSNFFPNEELLLQKANKLNNTAQINIINEKFRKNKFYTYLKFPEPPENYFDFEEQNKQQDDAKLNIPSQLSHLENKLDDQYFDRNLIAGILQDELENGIPYIKQKGNCLEILKKVYYRDRMEIYLIFPNFFKKQLNKAMVLSVRSSQNIQKFLIEEKQAKNDQGEFYYTFNFKKINFFEPLVCINDLGQNLNQFQEIVDMKSGKIFNEISYCMTSNNQFYAYQPQSYENLINSTNQYVLIKKFLRNNYNDQIISFDTTNHPKQQLMLQYNLIGLFDQRLSNLNVYSQQPGQDLPYERFHSIQHLDEMYFLVKTTNYIQLYDIRSPLMPVYQQNHFMDDCVPNISSNTQQIWSQNISFHFSGEKNGSAFCLKFDQHSVKNVGFDNIQHKISRLFNGNGMRENLNSKKQILVQQGIFSSSLQQEDYQVRGINFVNLNSDQLCQGFLWGRDQDQGKNLTGQYYRDQFIVQFQCDNFQGLNCQLFKIDKEDEFLQPISINDANVFAVNHNIRNDFIEQFQKKKCFQQKNQEKLDIQQEIFNDLMDLEEEKNIELGYLPQKKILSEEYLKDIKNAEVQQNCKNDQQKQANYNLISNSEIIERSEQLSSLISEEKQKELEILENEKLSGKNQYQQNENKDEDEDQDLLQDIFGENKEVKTVDLRKFLGNLLKESKKMKEKKFSQMHEQRENSRKIQEMKDDVNITDSQILKFEQSLKQKEKMKHKNQMQSQNNNNNENNENQKIENYENEKVINEENIQYSDEEGDEEEDEEEQERRLQQQNREQGLNLEDFIFDDEDYEDIQIGVRNCFNKKFLINQEIMDELKKQWK
ncbi:hypothetical protein PPERSA_03562 [Pseudocohnilembus persalinus]|uniref:Uncharacterized protein n=1 Tax=Pseudocohnilembus persalinus TaxID=266149 RepID=A0A0V0QPX2_PSEPJ|nr:hypothetical protein PPERSA_03562 [Pseudocohnilembus persalinus]|eukprot:KRX04322.1 hypothetical protein PPERSA_03562 [Pseudocohnilembus persalinus]